MAYGGNELFAAFQKRFRIIFGFFQILFKPFRPKKI